jgi:hypothetical protein
MMGGGPDTPARQPSDKTEVVLCTLPWPITRAEKAIADLEEEFKDLKVKYFHHQHEKGKMMALDVPAGKSYMSLDEDCSMVELLLQYHLLDYRLIDGQTFSPVHLTRQHCSGSHPMLKLFRM